MASMTKSDALLQTRSQDSLAHNTEQQISPGENKENVEWSHFNQGVESGNEQTNSGIAINDINREDKISIKHTESYLERNIQGESPSPSSNDSVNGLDCNLSTSVSTSNQIKGDERNVSTEFPETQKGDSTNNISSVIHEIQAAGSTENTREDIYKQDSGKPNRNGDEFTEIDESSQDTSDNRSEAIEKFEKTATEGFESSEVDKTSPNDNQFENTENVSTNLDHQESSVPEKRIHSTEEKKNIYFESTQVVNDITQGADNQQSDIPSEESNLNQDQKDPDRRASTPSTESNFEQEQTTNCRFEDCETDVPDADITEHSVIGHDRQIEGETSIQHLNNTQSDSPINQNQKEATFDTNNQEGNTNSPRSKVPVSKNPDSPENCGQTEDTISYSAVPNKVELSQETQSDVSDRLDEASVTLSEDSTENEVGQERGHDSNYGLNQESKVCDLPDNRPERSYSPALSEVANHPKEGEHNSVLSDRGDLSSVDGERTSTVQPHTSITEELSNQTDRLVIAATDEKENITDSSKFNGNNSTVLENCQEERIDTNKQRGSLSDIRTQIKYAGNSPVFSEENRLREKSRIEERGVSAEDSQTQIADPDSRAFDDEYPTEASNILDESLCASKDREVQSQPAIINKESVNKELQNTDTLSTKNQDDISNHSYEEDSFISDKEDSVKESEVTHKHENKVDDSVQQEQSNDHKLSSTEPGSDLVEKETKTTVEMADKSNHNTQKDNKNEKQTQERIRSPSPKQKADISQNGSIDGTVGETDEKGDNNNGTRTHERIRSPSPNQKPDVLQNGFINDTGHETDGTRENAKETLAQERIRSPSPRQKPMVLRNGVIDDVTREIIHTQSLTDGLFQEVNLVLQHYKDGIAQKSVSDFIRRDIGKFQGDFMSLSRAYEVTGKLCVSINRRMKELRSTTEDLNKNMNKKLRDEDLTLWIATKTDAEEEHVRKLAEEKTALEKSTIAKAAEARAAVARAAVELAESQKLAAEAEAEAAEAFVVLQKATENAESARARVEEAHKAAEEKRKIDEEAKRRAEIRAKQKAEEEKRKQGEEERQLKLEAEKMGTSFEDEKQKFLNEKEQRERERKNPANWRTYKYKVNGRDYDPDVGCVIRAIEGSLRKEDVKVSYIDQLSGILTLVENEELVGNIIEIQPMDPDKKFSFEEPLLIAFPHCSPRGVLSREPVIKMLQSNGKWTELNTSDVHFDDMKEMKFVETKTKKFGTFVVVFKLKKDYLVFQKRGGKATSTVDSRVTFINKSDTFRVNVNFTLEMQPVDSSTVSDVRRRKPEECGDLLSSSYIIKFSIPNRKFPKPLSVTLPVPPVSSSRSKRPATAGPVASQKEKTDARPQTARRPTKYDDDSNDDDLHMLVREKGGTVWTKIPNFPLVETKNKDMVTFEMAQPFDRFCVLRTKTGTPVDKVEKMLPIIETLLSIRLIRIFLRQRSENLYETAVACCPGNRMERLIRHLNDDGYDEGPPPSKELFVKEGQKMEIRFRSNIGCVSEDVDLNFTYNTHFRNKVELCVEELDKFAQKGFDTYRGFAQIYTKGLVPKPIKSSDEGSSGRGGNPKTPKVEMIEEDLLMTELLITIPKPDPEPPKPLATAPVSIKTDGTVDDKLLRQVSSELGDEWKSLAQYLNIKPVRIQAILRQHVNKSNGDTRYDMLVSWAKRIPRATDKADLLCRALTAAGRGDIAEEIKRKDEEMKKVRAHTARDSYLRKAFVKIAQDSKAVNEWRKIALQLGIPSEEVQAIENNKQSGRERCYQSLKRWREMMGETATMTVLTRNLKICNCRFLASEVEALSC